MAEQTNGNAASNESILKLSSSIVAAYVSNNPVPASELPAMIKSVHGMLVGIAAAPNADAPTAQKPAVAIRKSVTPEYVVCLEDGKKLKMLKRYLRSNYDMTPEEYRAKWGLPADYPMVAPNYAKQRSEFAKQIGLGRTSSSSKRRKRA
ncbi:MAG TPA: MucR family transcriptional regulator [Rhizomicrobium sp.]|jgi:predicted transcriptional regulator